MNAGRIFRRVLLIICLGIALLVSACGGSAGILGHAEKNSPGSAMPPGLSVRMLDIGQGDALLLSKDGEFVLIDSGDVDHREQMAAYLKKYGVRELKTVIITHPHADHIGGMYTVFRECRVDQVYDNGQPTSTNTYRTYLKEIEKRNIPYKAVRAGDVIPFFKDVAFRVLGPAEIMKDDKGRPALNNNSVVGRLTYGNFTMLFTGDCEKEEEMSIMKGEQTFLKSDVLKVGHHGSKTSYSAQFLKAVSPQAALISAGAGNIYGLPHEITLKKLEQVGIRIYRTDRDGTITVESNGTGYAIRKEH